VPSLLDCNCLTIARCIKPFRRIIALVGVRIRAYLSAWGRDHLAGLICDAGADAGLAEQAARWAEGFHPPLRVTLQNGEVTLWSDVHSQAELRAIWRSSLLNEKLTADGTRHRAAVIEALVR
jgi:hypothetical protein